MGVYLTDVHLIGVHLMGVPLIGVPLSIPRSFSSISSQVHILRLLVFALVAKDFYQVVPAAERRRVLCTKYLHP
jgi:hypothetical protein